MTARHCAVAEVALPPGEEPPVASVLTFGPGEPEPSVPVAPASTSVHPTLDVALLFFDATSTFMDVEPVPLLREPLGEDWLGVAAEFAGFGLAETDLFGRRFAVERIESLEPARLVLDGHGVSGACAGDSGGPLLGRANDGSIRVIGVLDDGSADCVGIDRFTRADLIVAWSREVASLADTEAETPGCAGLDAAGQCYRNRAFWCEGGSRHVDACGARMVGCTYGCAAGGFRCAVD